MLNKISKLVLAIVERLAIAFFFAIFLLFLVRITVGDLIGNVMTLISKLEIVEKLGEDINIEYDYASRSLKNYPSWGTEWATIDLPTIDRYNIPVVQGDTLDLLKKNAGHSSGTYFPGEGGTIVIGAHNSRAHFYYLPKIQIGDQVTIHTDYGDFTYEVYKTLVMHESDSTKLYMQKEEEILMLYTCYPVTTIGPKSHRFVAYAKLVNISQEGTNES